MGLTIAGIYSLQTLLRVLSFEAWLSLMVRGLLISTLRYIVGVGIEKIVLEEIRRPKSEYPYYILSTLVKQERDRTQGNFKTCACRPTYVPY